MLDPNTNYLIVGDGELLPKLNVGTFTMSDDKTKITRYLIRKSGDLTFEEGILDFSIARISDGKTNIHLAPT